MEVPERAAVEEQLARITASPEFVAASKLTQFLQYVVEQRLQGRSSSIKQYTIAVEALGYGPGFDPANSPVIRVTAGRLRRALDRYYVNQGATDPVRILLPKGTYVPTFSASTPVAPASTSPGDVPTARAHAVAEPALPTIAVFEFENLSELQDDTYIAVGLTAEITVALTSFADLLVLGPLTHEKRRTIDFDDVHHRYGAQFALQGWIRRRGTKIRVTTDLMDTTTGVSLWGQSFMYDLDNISLLDIEHEVTGRVAASIGDGLGVIFRRLQPDSYREYTKLNDITRVVLCYNHAWTTQDREDYRKALQAVHDALVGHPQNALLIALQANLYYGDVIQFWDMVPDSISKMEPLARKAISLDPNLQLAQYNLVVLHSYFNRARECSDAARRVVAMNPNHARILAGCAVATTAVGDYELGKALIEQAKRLNPQHPGWYQFIDYVISFRHGDYEEAWSNAQLIQTPGVIWQSVLRTAALGRLGRVREAKPYIEECLQLKSDFRQRPREYIKPLLVTDEHVDMICGGMAKAGLQLAITPDLPQAR